MADGGEPAIVRLINKAKPVELADARPPEFSDEGLALQFATRHVGDLRHVAAWGRWLLWAGARWRVDETLRAFDLSREVCRAASARVPKAGKRVAAAVASAKTVAAVVSLARADRRLAATVDQWDGDPWLLVTDDGVK